MCCRYVYAKGMFILKAVEQYLYDGQRYRGKEDTSVPYSMHLRYIVPHHYRGSNTSHFVSCSSAQLDPDNGVDSKLLPSSYKDRLLSSLLRTVIRAKNRTDGCTFLDRGGVEVR